VVAAGTGYALAVGFEGLPGRSQVFGSLHRLEADLRLEFFVLRFEPQLVEVGLGDLAAVAQAPEQVPVEHQGALDEVVGGGEAVLGALEAVVHHEAERRQGVAAVEPGAPRGAWMP
jgi:hypothetical protein